MILKDATRMRKKKKTFLWWLTIKVTRAAMEKLWDHVMSAKSGERELIGDPKDLKII